MSQGKIMDGVFAINKPCGISSAQVLRDLQKHFTPSELFAPSMKQDIAQREKENSNQRHRRRRKKPEVKIGHGGTLDPLATGVLITGIGKGTKSLQQFLLCTKVYEATILFGTATDTYDRGGKVLRRAPYEHITKELVEKNLEQFRGKFNQLPPLFSALKMDGKPLYEYAREGKPIPREIARRPVEVLELEMVEWMEGGTHEHVAPKDDAGYAEINLANKLWKQEGVKLGGAPATGKGSEKDDQDRRELFERKKRKMSNDQDELVKELPPSKVRRASLSDAKMSGGLAIPEAETEPTAEEAIPSIKETIEQSPTPAVSSPPLASDAEAIAKGPPAAKLRMVVTSGFYVRSLCHDLGAAVGSAALMADLSRTRQGDFVLGENVLEYDDLEKGEEVWAPQVESMLDAWNASEKAKQGTLQLNKDEIKPETADPVPAAANTESGAPRSEPATQVEAQEPSETKLAVEGEKQDA